MGSNFTLKAHIVLTVKYRKMLLSAFGGFIKKSFESISNTYNFKIVEMEVDKDHIHLLVDYHPKQSISKVVKLLKQISTYEVWNKYEASLRNHIYGKKVFWSSGYYVSSVGEVNENRVITYIRNQGKAKPCH
jgi:putative transposase